MIGPFLIAVEVALQNIGKEKEPENGKHDKKFNENDPPEFSAPGHAFEAIKIESEDFPDHCTKKVQQINKLNAKHNQMCYFYLLQIM